TLPALAVPVDVPGSGSFELELEAAGTVPDSGWPEGTVHLRGRTPDFEDAGSLAVALRASVAGDALVLDEFAVEGPVEATASGHYAEGRLAATAELAVPQVARLSPWLRGVP